MNNCNLTLEVLSETYCVCKGLPIHLLSSLTDKNSFFSFTKTTDELSVVCSESSIVGIEDITCEKGWKALKVAGPLDFGLIGILANLSSILANANISIFVISTYDTDYLLIKDVHLTQAINCLEAEGHHVSHA